LGIVLFQFPPWFVYRDSNLEHILTCQRILHDIPIAVEFRHKSWFEDKHRDSLFAFELEHALTHVIADEPQGISNSIPAVWEFTAPVAVIRLHGRNADTWDTKGLPSASERLNSFIPRKD
jgi:uncharacterized protein YecE (DUF72 family)